MQSLIKFLVLSIIYAIWAFAFYFITRICIRGLRSKNWPATDGEIVVSETERLRRSETGMVVDKHRAIIRYKYTVSGRVYISDVLSYGELAFQIFNRGLRSRKSVDSLMLKYPIGSKVTVYYDPAKPVRAVLKPGIFDFNLILMIIIFGIVGLLLFIPLLTLL